MATQFQRFTGEVNGRAIVLPQFSLWEHWQLFVAGEDKPEYMGPWSASESTMGLTDGRMLLEIDRHLIPGDVNFVSGPRRENVAAMLEANHEGQEFVPLPEALSNRVDDVCRFCCGFSTLALGSLSGALIDLVPCCARYVCDYDEDQLSRFGDICPQATNTNPAFRINGREMAGRYVLLLLMLARCEVATVIRPGHDGHGMVAFRFQGGRGVVRPLKLKEIGA